MLTEEEKSNIILSTRLGAHTSETHSARAVSEAAGLLARKMGAGEKKSEKAKELCAAAIEFSNEVNRAKTPDEIADLARETKARTKWIRLIMQKKIVKLDPEVQGDLNELERLAKKAARKSRLSGFEDQRFRKLSKNIADLPFNMHVSLMFRKDKSEAFRYYYSNLFEELVKRVQVHWHAQRQ